MTNKSFPLTPPTELVAQWRNKWMCHFDDLHPAFGHDFQQYVITQAAQWGWAQRGAANEAELQQARDEKLKGCEEWVADKISVPEAAELRATPPPEPPTDEELWAMGEDYLDDTDRTYAIKFARAALERWGK